MRAQHARQELGAELGRSHENDAQPLHGHDLMPKIEGGEHDTHELSHSGCLSHHQRTRLFALGKHLEDEQGADSLFDKSRDWFIMNGRAHLKD